MSLISAGSISLDSTFKHKEYLPQWTAKERDKKYRGFTFCTAAAILHCTFYPALLPRAGYCENDRTA
jgi:hypothetical protein